MNGTQHVGQVYERIYCLPNKSEHISKLNIERDRPDLPRFSGVKKQQKPWLALPTDCRLLLSGEPKLKTQTRKQKINNFLFFIFCERERERTKVQSGDGTSPGENFDNLALHVKFELDIFTLQGL